MTQVIRKNAKLSTKELYSSLNSFIDALKSQDEKEAVERLTDAAKEIMRCEVNSDGFKAALTSIMNTFNGELNLNIYTISPKEKGKWTTAHDLFLLSKKVKNHTKRLL